MIRPTTQPLDLDAIETAARNAARIGSGIHPDTTIVLVAEVRRLRAERDRYRTAWRLARTRALSTGGAADRYAARAREGQTALQDMLGVMLGAQLELDAAQAEAAALRTVLARPDGERRTLTESELNRAWHAIEGAAGEEGADPGTVLNAVLRALDLNPPAPAPAPAVQSRP